MIPVNELRIGNWVSNSEGYYTVDINMLYDAGTLEYYPIDPIPLTPEWLERFGFSKENRMYYKGPYFIVMPIPRGECGFGLKNTIGIIATFQYVHQLQNLYFALQKIELK